MPSLNTAVLDNGLSQISGTGRRFDACHTEPTTFAQATGAFSVGNKTGLTIAAPQAMAAPVGRRVVVPAITDGNVTATSTGAADDAQFWAITDPGTSTLWATGTLAAGVMVVSGDGFTTPAFDIGIPLPV